VVIVLQGEAMSKKFKMILWGLQHKNGTMLLGHDMKPITNHTKKEAQQSANKDWNVVRIIMERK
jgi:hypothetical protein